MVRLILGYSDQKNGLYLEEKIREVPFASVMAVSSRGEELPGLVGQSRPDGLLLDISEDPKKGLSLVALLNEKMPSVPVLLACQKARCDPDLILAAMRMKVREFLPIPFEDELKEALERLRLEVVAPKDRTASDGGKLVCVISCKGGSGSTLIATSLAISLAKQHHKSTALVDLNLQLGDVCLFLNMKPQATLADLVQNINRLDSVLLREMMMRHASGVQVLAAPNGIEEMGLIHQPHLHTIYTILKSVFDWVVVDMQGGFDEPMLGTLPYADEILLVALLNIPALRNTKRYLEILERLGYGGDQVKIIVI